ncbi:hypothetical protein [Sporosarcina aquimarina]|uniref:Uncharacterized protein n=1 Tax=Sporosarcina aquimarina TaxID=114975 RepID=A0ABU4G0C6_9BACL|nr:hypothetical protein [Sporosarcina aquimarina]MDW0110412.1 hypothetical protein [Sporosarcina aquimarina]
MKSRGKSGGCRFSPCFFVLEWKNGGSGLSGIRSIVWESDQAGGESAQASVESDQAGGDGNPPDLKRNPPG